MRLKAFIFSLISIGLISCNENLSDSSENNNTNTQEKLNGSLLVSIDTLLLNGVHYLKHSIYYDSLDYETVLLINKDTIDYYKDELYVSDTIYDINRDDNSDLSITYQSTNGFFTYVHLFDSEKNALNITPFEFHNFVSIDSKHFFLVKKNYFIWEFKKYEWLAMKNNYMQSLYVEFSNEKRHFFKLQNHDTLKLSRNEVPEIEMQSINIFISGE
jgi:hypothetical protein